MAGESEQQAEIFCDARRSNVERADFDEVVLLRFRAAADAWHYFQAQPPGCRKTASWWVMSAKQAATASDI